MPTIQEVRYDSILQSLLVGYEPEGLIADDVLPSLPVAKEDGIYWIFGKERFTTPETHRAPRSRYREIDWKMTQDNYHAEEYGLEHRIDDRERDNSALPGSLDQEGAEILVDMLSLGREKRVAALVLNPTNVTQGTTLSGANQWSDVSGGDPIGVAHTAHDTIRAATGRRPNSVAMGYPVASALLRNAKIKGEMVQGEQPTEATIAKLFGVENVYVGNAMSSANKKGQTFSAADIWGKDVLFYFKQARPGRRRVGFGYQLRVQDFKTFRWRDTPVNCDVVRVNEIQSEKLTATQLAYLVKNAVA